MNRNDDVPVYVKESLTPFKRKLFKMACEKGKTNGFKFIWVRNGNVYARASENSAILQIRYKEDMISINDWHK